MPQSDAEMAAKRAYVRPQDILAAADLSTEQKKKALADWEYDLRLEMVASEENMTSPRPGKAAELLTEVHNCLTKLTGIDPDNQPPPTKTGGGVPLKKA